jgi:hypothetical protein
MRSMIVLPLLVVAAAGGCRSAPPATPDAYPAATTRPSAPAVIQPTSTASPAAAAQAASSAQSDADLLKQGYRQTQLRGETVYCRRELVTGSRFSRNVCLTAQQIRDRAQQAKDDLQTVGAGCQGSYCK